MSYGNVPAPADIFTRLCSRDYEHVIEVCPWLPQPVSSVLEEMCPRNKLSQQQHVRSVLPRFHNRLSQRVQGNS